MCAVALSAGIRQSPVGASASGEDEADLIIMHVDANDEEFQEYISQAEEKLDLNIRLEECPENADIRQAKISTILASGDSSVDIISVNDEMISEFKYKGYLTPLNDTVMTDSVWEEYPQEYFREMCMVGDEVYSVPYKMDILLFWVNQEVLAQAGMEKIETGGDFFELKDRLAGTGKYAYGDAWEQTYVYNALLQFSNFFGGDYKDWTNVHTRQAMRFLKSLLDEGVTSPQILVDQYDQMTEKFLNGDYGCMFMYSGGINSIIAAGMYGEDRIHIAPLPSFQEKATNYATWQYILNNASENKEAAVRFLRYVASSEGSMDYANLARRFPVRLDVLEDESLQLEGIDEVRRYLETVKLCVRPMGSDGLTTILEMGALFQQYVLGKLEENVFYEKAQEVIAQYYE